MNAILFEQQQKQKQKSTHDVTLNSGSSQFLSKQINEHSAI